MNIENKICFFQSKYVEIKKTIMWKSENLGHAENHFANMKIGLKRSWENSTFVKIYA